MPRCAIDINNGQLGHNPPGTAATRYVNDPPTNINGLHLNDIPNLYAFLRNRKITSKDLPHVDRLLPKHQVNLAIFDCKVRLLDTQNGSILGYITSQMQALEDLVNRLEQGQDLSTEQQVFVTRIASGGGNGVYWAWFMELKCAVAVVELTV